MPTHFRRFAIGALLALLPFSAASSGDAVPAFTIQGYAFHNVTSHFSIGYTFTVTSPINITALGVMDFGGDSIAATQPFPVNIYYSNLYPEPSLLSASGHIDGYPVAGASALVTATDPILAPSGGAYLGGDGFRYHMLATPITLAPDTYDIQSSNFGTGYAAQWTNVQAASGLIGPAHFTYGSDDIAGYAGGTADEYFPGAAGPNFLVAPVPEPAGSAVAALTCLLLIRKR